MKSPLKNLAALSAALLIQACSNADAPHQPAALAMAESEFSVEMQPAEFAAVEETVTEAAAVDADMIPSEDMPMASAEPMRQTEEHTVAQSDANSIAATEVALNDAVPQEDLPQIAGGHEMAAAEPVSMATEHSVLPETMPTEMAMAESNDNELGLSVGNEELDHNRGAARVIVSSNQTSNVTNNTIIANSINKGSNEINGFNNANVFGNVVQNTGDQVSINVSTLVYFSGQ